MKYSEELKNAMMSLTDRYGITLSEVPDRFKEKIIQIIGEGYKSEIDHAFKSLEMGFLRNVRVRATHYIQPDKLNDTRNLIAGIEGFSNDDVNENLQLWVDIFKVRTDASIEELDADDFFSPADPNDSLQDVSPIIDNTAITAPLEVERVVNQFDTESAVSEPTVDDYDGNFSDSSFETVADFEISENESNLIEHLETSVTTPGYNDDAHSRSKKNKKRQQPQKPPEPVAYEPPPWEKNSSEHTIENAFVALREQNPSLASRIMMELARDGNTRAQFHLGEFYIDGIGIEKSLEKAKYWLRKAASRGSMPARTKLEELENQENSGGCCGCLIVGFIILIAFNVIGSLF
ncbi:MAG: uncharacterized protein PWR01_3925 [Clostridiales bacterium]|jgi:hypothetical protein|nr:uncharacterized protein [Clostridiales bacterium]MDN5282852.1 uncharacterized protein [Candidatus Ozemobacter sp.]